jgi:hypothetical protein
MLSKLGEVIRAVTGTSKRSEPDDSIRRFIPTSPDDGGLDKLAICSSLSPEATLEYVNANFHPRGRWRLATDCCTARGTNGAACHDQANRRHFIFELALER